MSKKVKVNPLFKGELTLPTINYPVKGGTLLVLEDDQYIQGDVQWALKKNYLLEEVEEKKGKKSKKDAKNTEIKKIIVEKGEVPKKPKLSAILSQLESSSVIDENYDQKKPIDPTKGEPKANPVVWDAYGKRGVDAKTGLKQALAQLKSIKMDVQQGEVDFDKESEEAEKGEKVEQKPEKRKYTRKDLESAKTIESKTLPLPTLDEDAENQFFVETAPTKPTSPDKVRKASKRISANNSEVE